MKYIDGIAQNCGNSTASAMELWDPIQYQINFPIIKSIKVLKL